MFLLDQVLIYLHVVSRLSFFAKHKTGFAKNGIQLF